MVTMRRGFLMLSFAIALCIITVTGCGNNPEQGKSQEEGSTEVTKKLEVADIENNEQILLDNDACTISFSGIESALTEKDGKKDISAIQEETSEEQDNSTLAEVKPEDFESVPIETQRSDIKSTENNFIIKVDMEKKNEEQSLHAALVKVKLDGEVCYDPLFYPDYEYEWITFEEDYSEKELKRAEEDREGNCELKSVEWICPNKVFTDAEEVEFTVLVLDAKYDVKEYTDDHVLGKKRFRVKLK